MTVRTRFAPSPTGYLHIGGVRTALFNWLFAKRHGGKFILRIDDTDQQRNVEEALAPILHGFRWLGLEWDEGPEVDGPFGPYFQSQRSDRYGKAVEQLIAKGAAYRDYARPEEIQAERDAAQQEGRPFVYSRKWMAESPVEAQRLAGEGREGVVRLKMPREGKLVLDDLVRGQVEFQWANEQDHVVQRADGSVLYNLASVVDDHEMETSHIIRAEEHLSNTPRQWFIFEALGWTPPQVAHLPYVAEPGSKNKLSKRKLDKYMRQKDFAELNAYGESIARRLGLATSAETFNPVIVEFYERIGFLPDALVNYLLLLGWSLDDKTEEFTREEMIANFSLERVNKAPASFDPQKLIAFQSRAMERLPIKQKVARCVSFLQRAGYVADPPSCDTGPYVTQIVQAASDRLRTTGDILDYDYFFVDDDKLVYDEKAFEKRIRGSDDAVELLTSFCEVLSKVEPFDAEMLESALKQFVDDRGIKIGQIIHALRVAVTGQAVGFGMFETMEILGRERCLARLRQTIEGSGP
jgi:glutamyl-tRNA synthetase